MTDTNKLLIKELDLDTMCTNPAIVIITKRGGGKTWACRSLLSHFRDIPVGIIISHTETRDPFFSKFFPAAFIYDEYSPTIFQKILARQRMIKKKQEEKEKQGKKIDTRLFLLMDDCLSGNKVWGKDNALREILFNGRHFDITYILTMQAPLGIDPELRSNFDYIFMLAVDNFNELKKYYEHYTGMFPTFNAFKEVYDELTNDYGIMVVKKRDAGKNICDKVFHYKASEISVSMIGCSQFKKFHELNFDDHWEDKKYEFDINTFVKKRNIGNFKVEKLDQYGKTKYE